MTRGEYDTTGFCDRGHHDSCSGTLHAATGHHWWCACLCHPVPVPAPHVSPVDARKALETFHAARSRLEIADA